MTRVVNRTVERFPRVPLESYSWVQWGDGTFGSVMSDLAYQDQRWLTFAIANAMNEEGVPADMEEAHRLANADVP